MFKLSDEKLINFIKQDLKNLGSLKARIEKHLDDLHNRLHPRSEMTAEEANSLEEVIHFAQKTMLS